MPKSQLETQIEKVTNENNVTEDWGLIMDIVDLINQSNEQKEALRVIVRRLNAKDPHIAMHTLTLLNACVSNCTRSFKLEVCSRGFIDELRLIILNKKNPKLSDRLAYMVYEWSNDFKNDPALSLVPSFYNELKSKGVEFKKDDSKAIISKKNIDLKKEEDDLAKAIQLSLKENQAKQAQLRNSSHTNNEVRFQTASLYGTLPQTSSVPTGGYQQQQDKRKVKALYDFEAAEENEITFKAGDILVLLDDSDPNWWKGSNYKQEGLFPSNFVTSDLSAELENLSESVKKVSFNEEVSVKNLPPTKITIDEGKIDECVYLVQNADPTGEIHPDTEELIQLEENCYCMGPLIDQELQKIDQKHAILEDLNTKLLESLQLYHSLMRESFNKNMSMSSSNQMASTSSYGFSQAQNTLPQYMPQSMNSSLPSLPLNNLNMQQPQQFFNMPPSNQILGGAQQPMQTNNPYLQQVPLNYQNVNPNMFPQQQQQVQFQSFSNANSNTNLAASLNDFSQMSSIAQVPLINGQNTLQ